jgi:hypothetical protein
MRFDFMRAEHIHLSGQRGNAPRPAEADAHVIPIPDQMIDNLCEALKFDDLDREYMRTLSRRHEAGEATLPERILIHLIPRLTQGCVIVSFE